MKQQVFYIHGGNPFVSKAAFIQCLRTCEIDDPHGLPSERWSGKLRSNLGEEYEVFTPEMPNKRCAQYEEWKIWFDRHLEFLNDNVIFVGFSLGGVFSVKYLIENDVPVKINALMLIGAPFIDGGLSDNLGRTTEAFKAETSKLTLLQEKIKHIHLFQSKDDFVVPYEEALKYKEFLPKATLHSFEDRNHFLQPEFPELIAKIKEIAGE